jgi:hypothetical protein
MARALGFKQGSDLGLRSVERATHSRLHPLTWEQNENTESMGSAGLSRNRAERIET